MSASMLASGDRIQPVRIEHAGADSLATCAQWVPHRSEKVFAFFSDVHNLERITPPFLRFAIRDVSTAAVQKDTLIRYRLRLHGLPLFWTTRIAVWDPPVHFRDVQIRGPFKVWEHDHEFVPEGEGTWLRDRVRYRTYLHPLSRLLAGRFIEADVRRIFAHRQDVIAELFD